MPGPPLVYLDTQDFSRFADAAAGRPREAGDVDLLNRLLDLRDHGRAKFAYSLMHLSELLQYEGGGRELTLRKAEMVERICGSNAFLHPSKLIALQTAELANRLGNGLVTRPLPTPLSDENAWYPSFRVPFAGLRETIDRALNERVAEMGGNRKKKRLLKRQVRRTRIADLPVSRFDDLASEYPFSPEMLRKIIPAVIDGRMSETEGARLFSLEFAEPSRFVKLYFEKYDGQKTLPRWMRDFGEKLAFTMEELRKGLAPFMDDPELLPMLRSNAEQTRWILARRLVSETADEAEEIGLDPAILDQILGDELLLCQLPFCGLIGRLWPAYLEANSGILKGGRAPKPSDGGDLIHAITLPYCDLWRSASPSASKDRGPPTRATWRAGPRRRKPA